MIHGKKLLASVALAGGFSTLSLVTTPLIAQADQATDAAIGAALGSIVGTLLFDQGRDQYYYVRDGRRCYVTNRTARWYHEYGGYRGWERHNHDEGYHRGGYGRGDGDRGWRDGGDHGQHDGDDRGWHGDRGRHGD